MTPAHKQGERHPMALKPCPPEGSVLVLGHKLTPAHQQFLLSLPANGDWKKTSSRDFDRHGANAFRGFGKSGLIEGYYREEMRHRLTDEGQEVCAELRTRINEARNEP